MYFYFITFKNNGMLTTLEEVREVIRNVPDINQGGCGIAALAISRWINKNMYVRTKVVFVLGYDDSYRFKINNKAILKEEDPTSATHIGLIIYDEAAGDQKIIDCRKTFYMTNYEYTNTFADPRILLKAINKIGKWNSDFDRSNVAYIAKLLDIDLSDVDCRTESEYDKSLKACE